MLKTIEGVYRDGKVELTEVPTDVRNETCVIVTPFEGQSIDLRSGDIEISAAPKAAAALKRTGARWLCLMATMPPKPFYERGDVILVLFPLLIYTPPQCVGLLLSQLTASKLGSTRLRLQ
jgi:hypothetical protein